LSEFVRRVRDPNDPEFQRFLKASEFVNRFSPSSAQYGTVQQYLVGIGCTITDTTANRLTVAATCPAGAIQDAMRVKLTTYRAANGRSFYLNTTEPQLPADVAQIVQSIGGLDTVAVLHPHLARPNGQVTDQSFPGYTPQQLWTAYNL